MNSSSNRDAGSSSSDADTVIPLPGARLWRLRQRVVHGPLYDPVVQGVFLMMGTALFASAAWGLRSNGLFVLGNVFIAAAVGCSVGFLLLSGRALERDKLVEYWKDRRALRLELRESRAEVHLLARALSQLEKREHADAVLDPKPALIDLVNDMHAVVASRHEDSAALLVLESGGSFTVMHAAVSPGSRFAVLRAGTTCSATTMPFAETLKRHAQYDRSFQAEVDDDVLRIVLLSTNSFDAADDARLSPVPSCLSLLAGSWRSAEHTPARRRLHQVG